MLKKHILHIWLIIMALLGLAMMPSAAVAQGYPAVNPQAYYTDKEGLQQETQSISDGEAPLDVSFRANPTNMDGHTPAYEWHFVRAATNSEPQQQMMIRYEEDTQFTFTESGTYNVTLKTTLTDTGDVLDSVTIVVAISESKLEYPNAFSPNGDGRNDTFKAKEGWRSIIEFDAWIINRWGQRIFHMSTPADEWDGTYNGHPVKDGVYYLLVRAKGADGRKYNIRRDVNLLRGYTENGATQ